MLLFIGLSGCKDEQFDLDDDPLDGVIGGDPWVYTAGSVGQDLFTSNLNALLLAQETSDACAVVNTIRPHITMTFPPRRGNYTLSVDNVQVIFNLEGGSTKYTATAGFLEVVGINSTEVIGYLSADFDEKNNVQGSFFLRVCN